MAQEPADCAEMPVRKKCELRSFLMPVGSAMPATSEKRVGSHLMSMPVTDTAPEGPHP